jgi:hypothetical protein
MPSGEQANLLQDPALPSATPRTGSVALTTSNAALPAHAALNELARLLGRRAARRHRQGLGSSQVGIAPVLALAALALGAIMFGMRLMRGH